MKSLNWKLILQLSLFGAAMALATVFFVPSTVEPILWLIIFVLCAVIIAKQCTQKYFLHGLFVSLVNSVWMTAGHIVFAVTYLERHPQEAAMMPGEYPRLMMLLTGPLVGLISGVILGAFALVAHKLIKKP